MSEQSQLGHRCYEEKQNSRRGRGQQERGCFWRAVGEEFSDPERGEGQAMQNIPAEEVSVKPTRGVHLGVLQEM